MEGSILSNVINVAIGNRYVELCEQNIGHNAQADSVIMDLYKKLEDSLNKEQLSLLEQFDNAVTEELNRKQQAFYQMGFVDGLNTGVVISK